MTFPNQLNPHVHTFLQAMETQPNSTKAANALRQIAAATLGLNFHNMDEVRRDHGKRAFDRYAKEVEPHAAHLLQTAMATAELAFVQSATAAAEMALVPLRVLEERAQDQQASEQAKTLSIVAALQGISAGQAVLNGLEYVATQIAPHSPRAARAISRAQAGYLQSCLHVTSDLMLARNSITLPD